MSVQSRCEERLDNKGDLGFENTRNQLNPKYSVIPLQCLMFSLKKKKKQKGGKIEDSQLLKSRNFLVFSFPLNLTLLLTENTNNFL